MIITANFLLLFSWCLFLLIDSARFCCSAENLSASRSLVETYVRPEQTTADTTSKHITDYHHKNDRIKDVGIGFEPPPWDIAGWVENPGRWRGLLTFVIDFYTVFARGIVSTHRLQHKTKARLPHPPSPADADGTLHTHMHTLIHTQIHTPTLPILLPAHPWKRKNRCPGAVQWVWISSDEAH